MDKTNEPKVTYATVRDALDELHIECRFNDGQKFSPVKVDNDFPELANQIANALNTAADQSRVIEVMRTALELYGEKDFWCPREDGEDNDGADWWLGSTDGYTPALDALAEAQRIMEGEVDAKYARRSLS